MYDFITIDFETANQHMDSACSVGLVAVQGQEIVKEAYFLINPPTPEFNTKNISIHGITYDMVKDAGSFAEVWQEMIPFFRNTQYVLAHNVQFDMSEFYCCFEKYDIQAEDFLYMDTINIVRKCSGYDLAEYNLEAVATYYNVNMGVHHNAMDDARTLAQILIQVMKNKNMDRFQLLEKECHEYSRWFSMLNPMKTFHTKFKITFREDTMEMQELKSFAACVIADGIVELDEINHLARWINEHPELAGCYPFDKISGLCSDIFADGVVTDEEREGMLFLLKQFVDPIGCSCCNCKITFEEKIFVLSGDFTSGSKKEIEAKIAEKGGICKGGVTKKTDYLIVGGAGSDNWKFGNYGAKVSKALEMQESGYSIQIMKESDLMDCLE